MTTELHFDTETAANVLDMMAHERRLHVFELLVEQEWDVASLAKEVNLSQSALSQHLKKMRDLELVKVRRVRQSMFYSCQHAAVLALLSALTEIFDEANVATAAA